MSPSLEVICPCKCPDDAEILDAFCVTLVSKLPVAVCSVAMSVSLLLMSVRRTPVAVCSVVMSLSFEVICDWRLPDTALIYEVLSFTEKGVKSALVVPELYQYLCETPLTTILTSIDWNLTPEAMLLFALATAALKSTPV